MAKDKKTINPKGCEEFELDLTDYVTGDLTFLTRDRQQELFEHLRKCPKCLKQFWSWNETYSVIKGKQQSARPEFQKRMNALIEQFKSALARPDATVGVKMILGKPVLDNETEVGTPAGAVWRYLAKNGWVKVNDLTRDLSRTDRIDPDETKFAVGWLLRENKAYYTKIKQITFVYLNEQERKIYQNQAGQA